MGLFKDALKFPFKPFKRMWWFWISAIPIVGWVLFAGYLVDIVRHLIEHDGENLPPMGNIWLTFKNGLLFVIISAILGLISQLFLWIPRAGWVLLFATILLTPILLIQFALTRRFLDGFNVLSAGKLICRHFLRYVWYNILIIGNLLIWGIASLPIITVVITVPASTYGSIYLLAKFYKEAMHKRY
jgi:hypothetical protein